MVRVTVDDGPLGGSVIKILVSWLNVVVDVSMLSREVRVEMLIRRCYMVVR